MGKHHHHASEVEITVGHRIFFVHIAQMAELSCICADITSGQHCECLQPQLTVHSAYGE